MGQLAYNVALWTGLTLVLAAIIHIGIVLAFPWVVGIRLRSMGEPNMVVHAARVSADNNPIRRGSPDLIYSLCAFDVSRGPLHITAPYRARTCRCRAMR